MQCISGASLCHGNFESEFIEVARLRKNKFLSPGEIVATLGESMCITMWMQLNTQLLFIMYIVAYC